MSNLKPAAPLPNLLPDGPALLQLLESATPILDVRAPREFAQGAMPNSINVPILDDSQRDRVGRIYKRDGSAAAQALGHQLVSGKVQQQRLQAWQAACAQHNIQHLMCWRGGLRSQICQQWLATAGLPLTRIAGGYKAMRRACLKILADAAANHEVRWWVLAGKTGTAKTVLLNKFDHSIDLEGTAHHRGSAFGAYDTPQPAQASFENQVAADYLRLAPRLLLRPLMLEDESRTIGRVGVPETWHPRMQQSPLLLIQASLQERVTHIESEYVTEALQTATASQLLEKYTNAAQRIARRLGGIRHKQFVELLQQAFAGQRQHGDWIAYLLQEYYDPMYDYQLAKKRQRIIFSGSFAEVQAFVSSAPDQM